MAKGCDQGRRADAAASLPLKKGMEITENPRRASEEARVLHQTALLIGTRRPGSFSALSRRPVRCAVIGPSASRTRQGQATRTAVAQVAEGVMGGQRQPRIHPRSKWGKGRQRDRQSQWLHLPRPTPQSACHWTTCEPGRSQAGRNPPVDLRCLLSDCGNEPNERMTLEDSEWPLQSLLDVPAPSPRGHAVSGGLPSSSQRHRKLPCGHLSPLPRCPFRPCVRPKVRISAPKPKGRLRKP
jgi:hypothetical protein